MTNEIYDQLAQLLKEVNERFPEDGFKNRKRLNGILSDHVADAQREIRILLDAIDEGIIDTLNSTPANERSVQVDRLASRLESTRGIRSDIARRVVQACAFSVGAGPLPSTVEVGATSHTAATDRVKDDWVGVSEVAGGGQGQQARPQPSPDSKAGWFAQLQKKPYAWVIGVVVVGVIAFGLTQQRPTSKPTQQPQGQQPQGQQPQGQQPQGQPKSQNNAANGYLWYDGFGHVWNVKYSGNNFFGTSYVDGQPLTMRGRAQNNSIVYFIYNAANVQIAYGKGVPTNRTHIAYTTFNDAGQVIGTGVISIVRRRD